MRGKLARVASSHFRFDPGSSGCDTEPVNSPIPVAFNWSGGKDSAHALGRLLADDRYELRCLVTTVHGDQPASTVHEVPLWLLQAQADAIGVPLRQVQLAGSGLGDYFEKMSAFAIELADDGVRAVAFGDLEFSGALTHREQLFNPVGLEVIEPLWKLSSAEAMDQFLASGIDARIVVVDASVLDQSWLGRRIDRKFVGDLPPGVDPCGEYGEYHSFVTSAPYFRHEVPLAATGAKFLERQIGTREGAKTFGYWILGLQCQPDESATTEIGH